MAGAVAAIAVVLAARWWARSSAARIERLAARTMGLRVLARETVRYEPATGEHALAEDRRPPYDAVARELAGLGFTSLGDQAEIAQRGACNGVLRWFVDASGGTVASFAMIQPIDGGPPRSWLNFFSETAAGGFVSTTRGEPIPRLAWPPAIRSTSVVADLAGLLRAHRAALGDSALVPLATAVDVAAGRDRFHALIAAWRAAEPAASLLDADLHSLLGEHYEAVHRPLAAAIARLSHEPGAG